MTVSPRHQAALAFAACGIPVFPLQPGGKQPLRGSNGFQDASADAYIINHFWSQDDYNIGLCPDDIGACVVDIDPKHGGSATWEALIAAHGNPGETNITGTPSGGRHLWFRGSLPGPTAGRLGEGIDTRGRRSYVVVPPSVVDGRPYTGHVPERWELARLPEWITEAAGAVVAPREARPGVELDRPDIIDRGLREIRRRLHSDPPTDGRLSDQTYRLAAALKDIGCSVDTATELILAHWSQAPRIEQVTRNAYRYGQNEPGSDADPSPEDAQRWLDMMPPSGAGPPGLVQPYTAERVALPAGLAVSPWPVIERASTLALRDHPLPDWVWQDRVLAFEPNLLTGDGGVGKTTLAENIAVAVAAGIPLLGAATVKQPVLLLVAEDGYGPVLANLARIRAELQAPPGCLDDVHVLSVESDRVAGPLGHQLVTITDDGAAIDSEFMQQCIAAKLHGFGGPALWIMDPLAEFAQFDRYNDVAARALPRRWLREVCQINNRQVTVLVNDHPSVSGMESGRHYGGSAQIRNAFSFFATLRASGEWSGIAIKQRELILETMKGRYTAEGKVKLIRTSVSPTFILSGTPQHIPIEEHLRVYKYILARIDTGLSVQKTNHGHGPKQIAAEIGLDEMTVKVAIPALIGRNWLAYDTEQTPASVIRGPMAPDPAAY